MKTLKNTLQTLLVSDAFGNFLRFVLRQRIGFHNATLNIQSPHIRGKVVSLLFFKRYEKEEMKLIKKYLNKNLPAIDLGASIGAISCNVAKLSNAPIVCLEASPSLSKIVTQNLVENKIQKDQFIVIQSALSSQQNNGKFLHFSPRGSNELGKLIPTPTKDSIKVKSTSLSQLVDDHIKGDFVLISDIEGAEVSFLFDDYEKLAQCNQLFIELHPTSWEGIHYSIDDLIVRILELGFHQVASIETNFYFERHATN